MLHDQRCVDVPYQRFRWAPGMSNLEENRSMVRLGLWGLHDSVGVEGFRGPIGGIAGCKAQGAYRRWGVQFLVKQVDAGSFAAALSREERHDRSCVQYVSTAGG